MSTYYYQHWNDPANDRASKYGGTTLSPVQSMATYASNYGYTVQADVNSENTLTTGLLAVAPPPTTVKHPDGTTTVTPWIGYTGGRPPGR